MNTVHQVVVDAINQVMSFDKGFFQIYRKGLETALGANADRRIRDIEADLTERQKQLITLAEDDPNYKEVVDAILDLREEKRAAMLADADITNAMKRVEDLMTFVKERPCRIDEYDESLVRQFLEKIIVYDDHFTVYFKSGMEIMIE